MSTGQSKKAKKQAGSQAAQEILKIARPDDFVITVIANSEYEELRTELDPLIREGTIQYYDCDQEPEILEKVGLEEAPEVPVVIVSAKGAEEGLACAVSMMGNSVIVHCEDKVIPLLPWNNRRRLGG
ncbi:MAG: hypothetical protein ABIH46_02390 [Chloroflexota bacterium]